MLSQALTWLCEEPDHPFTFNMILRRGWPGLAVALAGYWPDLTIWLVVGLKAGAVIAGLLTQGVLKIAEYLLRGAERALPAKPIASQRRLRTPRAGSAAVAPAPRSL